jgi:hypothetical protein
LACSQLEELGFTVRKCVSKEEAAERARHLRAAGHLRCIIAGGGSKGCGQDCTTSHSEHGNCLICGYSWDYHRGHTCNNGNKRGSWLIPGITSSEVGSNATALALKLVGSVPIGSLPIPPTRIIMYSAGADLTEELLLAMWKKGIAMTDDAAYLVEWVVSHPVWPPDCCEDDDGPAPPLTRENTSGLRTLKSLRQRLCDVRILCFYLGLLFCQIKKIVCSHYS